jgi:hypothetical protein
VDSGGAATVVGWSLVRVPSDENADWQTIADDGQLLELASGDPHPT